MVMVTTTPVKQNLDCIPMTTIMSTYKSVVDACAVSRLGSLRVELLTRMGAVEEVRQTGNPLFLSGAEPKRFISARLGGL